MLMMAIVPEMHDLWIDFPSDGLALLRESWLVDLRASAAADGACVQSSHRCHPLQIAA